jgi:hypothetical protein
MSTWTGTSRLWSASTWEEEWTSTSSLPPGPHFLSQWREHHLHRTPHWMLIHQHEPTIIIYVRDEGVFIFFNVDDWRREWAQMKKFVIRVILVYCRDIHEVTYMAVVVELYYLTTFRVGCFKLQFGLIRIWTQVNVINRSPASWWMNAHESAVLLEGSTN